MEENVGNFPQGLSKSSVRGAFPCRNLPRASLTIALFAFAICVLAPPCSGDTLAKVEKTQRLIYGSDMEGGGPFIYPDPDRPGKLRGFEVELMDLLAAELGVKAEMSQGQWDTLLEVLDSGRVDIVVNGYEWTQSRSRRYLASRPYYVYQLQLMSRRDSPLNSWRSLETASEKAWKIGVLRGSVAEPFAHANGGRNVRVVGFDGATDAMESVVNRQIDATLQDLPAARFYIDRFPALALAGDPVGRGYYVMYMRKNDVALKARVDAALIKLVENGSLRSIYEKYAIWTDVQGGLASWAPEPLRMVEAEPASRGWRLIWKNAPLLGKAAAMTVFLSLTSMPLAILLGLMAALARLYGPLPLRWLVRCYIEIIRGTPLMLQLYVLFFLLPRLGVTLDPLVAGICGLAINYSAYEAEIYRAGLQAIPVGQMEAALALGMSRAMAVRKVIVPQAIRIVIPPVTNDFIALFKDTSVCSVITLVELTKEYNILALSTGRIVEFGITAAFLYMAMSLPLSWFSNWFERRLAGESRQGEGVPA